MNEPSYFLDSNIFLRLMVKDDRKKVNDCEALIKAVEQGRLSALTSPIVLAEIVWVGQSFYKMPKEQIIEALRGICGIKRLEIKDYSVFILALELFHTHRVKFIDALIASQPAVSRQEMIVMSYDHDFDKLGVRRKEPNEIV